MQSYNLMKMSNEVTSKPPMSQMNSAMSQPQMNSAISQPQMNPAMLQQFKMPDMQNEYNSKPSYNPASRVQQQRSPPLQMDQMPEDFLG